MRETECNTDVESLNTFYLPQEFGNDLICVVYESCGEGCRCTSEAPIFILGDFNNCKLELSLPGFEQYVKCDTHNNKGLVKCYGNIENAYTAKTKPSLSYSDHNTVHLIPTKDSV